MGAFPQVDPRFDKVMETMNVPLRQRGDHRKWVRFYLHFCDKYGHDAADVVSLPLFLDKLKSKGQAQGQRDCARDAVELYRRLFEGSGNMQNKATLSSSSSGRFPVRQEDSLKAGLQNLNSLGGSGFSENPTHKKTRTATADMKAVNSDSGNLDGHASTFAQVAEASSDFSIREKSNAGWRDVETGLKNEIMLRHYSPKTFNSYSMWVRKFRGFLFNKNPSGLTGGDVKAFLTEMAVKKGFSASAQNQAFNALLFLFRHVLKRELGDLSDTPRAKRSKYVPTVLSRQEVKALFKNMKDPYRLVAELMYGCGLRLSEVANLRVQNFNFDTGMLSVQFGKGGKSRLIPLPKKIYPQIKEQLEFVKNLHQEDLQNAYNGVFMPGLFDRKAKNAAKDLK